MLKSRNFCVDRNLLLEIMSKLVKAKLNSGFDMIFLSRAQKLQMQNSKQSLTFEFSRDDYSSDSSRGRNAGLSSDRNPLSETFGLSGRKPVDNLSSIESVKNEEDESLFFEYNLPDMAPILRATGKMFYSKLDKMIYMRKMSVFFNVFTYKL